MSGDPSTSLGLDLTRHITLGGFGRPPGLPRPQRMSSVLVRELYAKK